MSEHPPTLRELAAQAAAAEGGDLWSCGRCGCRDWRVVNTYRTAAGIRRRRVCRNCGQDLLMTTEAPDEPESGDGEDVTLRVSFG